uniref:2-(3-amino-3-carboxypropyl)histidine synthase n=1 Tax=uncultured euryarchaeote Alv-FOS4 TaxID=337893 RepID=Q3SA68_9EURY|nr:diphthamide synthase subunit DPH2 [uncultured euryarchaeote Alv-FOS4]
MIQYSVDFAALTEEIKKRGYERVLLQLPEGLTVQATEFAEQLSEFEVYISSTPTYGACDIEVYPDMLTVHIGHSPIPNIKYPDNIIFVEAFSDASFTAVAELFASFNDCENVGIVASVQHIKKIQDVKNILESHGKKVMIGRGDSRITYPGQVLGCNFSAAREVADEVDCFAFLGTGVFHALGVRVSTGKSTFILDPYSGTTTDVESDADRFVRQRFGAIVKAQEAETFGIIVGAKIGQRRRALARAMKNMIEDAGKKAYLIYSDITSPERFYYAVDVFVNTSCPRIAYDDYLRFPKPVLTPIELQIALKYKLWENFRFDEIVEVD